jgi:hypothetical protein
MAIERNSFSCHTCCRRSMNMEVKQQRVYIDPRSRKDYDRFSPYFEGVDYANYEF